MEIINCNDYSGWFVGKFNPNLIYSKDIEFGYKKFPKILIQIIIFINIKLNTQYSLKEKFSAKQSKNL